MSKNSTFEFVLGLVAGATATIAGTLLVNKIKKEIKQNMCEKVFTSSDGDNSVAVSYGSSQTAKGLTYIRICATSASLNDECKLITFSRKKAELGGVEWIDNHHFKLSIGNGRRNHCCDINFEEEEIVANYYFQKNVPDIK